MTQPVPDVTEEDAWRVLERDYGQENLSELRVAISGLEVREKWRVVLACLKNAGGSRASLQRNLKEAPGYYRDLISEAEYPRATKVWSRLKHLSPEERQKVYAADSHQYDAWLHRA